MLKLALKVILIGTLLNLEREGLSFTKQQCSRWWHRALSVLGCCVLSCVCAWLYAFRLLVTGCCCRGRRLPWQANHSPQPHLPSGLGWSQVSSWAWSYTRWKGKLGREPGSWAWWVLWGWEGRERESRGAALLPCQRGSLGDRSWTHPPPSSPL